MPIRLEIEPMGDPGLFTGKLHDMADRAADFIPVFTSISTGFREVEKARFAAEGPGWQPLAASTVYAKALYGYSPKILGPRTGVLEASLTSGGDGSLEDITPHSVTMGTNVYYAIFHQMGMPFNPLRKLVKMTPALVLVWLNMLQEWFINGVSTEMTADAGSLL